MKKTMVRRLCALLLLCVLAAGLSVSARAAESFTPDGSVLLEKDGIKVTTAGLDTEPGSDGRAAIIWLDIENSGEKDVWLGVTDGSVNGFMSMVSLIEFYEENGVLISTNEDSVFCIPAHGSVRYALGYSCMPVPGLSLDRIRELELRFTLAAEPYTTPDYRSESIVISTGEPAEAVELESLGTLAVDNDKLKLVIGGQDYESWFGPFVYVYAENKTDHYIGIAGDSAEADGTVCNYLLGGLSIGPGKREASSLMFDSPIREMKGFENLTLRLSLLEAQDADSLYIRQERTALDPISVSYPPQNWGEYENRGLRLEIQPKYNNLLTVRTEAEHDRDLLFSVSETASLEAGRHEGAGWLFSIGTVSEARLHEMLCSDMSGAEVFARDAEGRYYLYYYPTDVRYERATVEQMKADQAQWTMLCEWANTVCNEFIERNGLTRVSYGNSDVDIYLARAAWGKDLKPTLSIAGSAPVAANAVDASPWVEQLMQYGTVTTEEKAPDGECAVLAFPEENVRLEFFSAPGGYVRLTSGERETLYQALWLDDDLSLVKLLQGWYAAAAGANT